jgi:hypothetical protein
VDVWRTARVDAGRRGREVVTARRPGLLHPPKGVQVPPGAIRVPPLHARPGNGPAAGIRKHLSRDGEPGSRGMPLRGPRLVEGALRVFRRRDALPLLPAGQTGQSGQRQGEQACDRDEDHRNPAFPPLASASSCVWDRHHRYGAMQQGEDSVVPLNAAETSTTRRGCRSLLRFPSVLWRNPLAAGFRPPRWKCRRSRLPMASAARRKACTRPAAEAIGTGSRHIASDLPLSRHAGSRCPERSRKDRTGRKGR